MSQPPVRALSVLLVEDSPTDGRLLLEALKPAVAAGEVVVQTVKLLSHALDALRGFDFSCVLLDLGLPDGKGIDNVRALREVDRKTAIIVLTGLADEGLASEALKQGAQDYLVKGESDAEQLLKQVRRAVQRNRQTYALEAQRDQAFFEASRDPLTLLPNAALFAERAHQQLSAARRDSRAGQPPFALACLRVKGFDALRERHLALLADELLKTLCERWSEVLRPGDTLARVGADEFALLRQPACSASEWGLAIDDFRRQVESLPLPAGSDCALYFASAVVRLDEEPLGIDAMLATARERARASAQSPAASADQKAATSPRVEQPSLELASSRWIPWVDTATKRCAGLELQLTEATAAAAGSNEQIAALTLAGAARLADQARAWSRMRFTPAQLALDIPAAALTHAGFVAALIERLLASGLPPSALQLEIGEAAFKHDAGHVQALAQLRKQGFRLVLDGDGTQDISLHDFAASALDGYKLSPALIATLMDESLQGAARRYTSAILGAAQQLGATVIATGVDSQAAISALRLIGVRYMQGRALMPALDAENVSVAFDRQLTI